MRKEVSERSKWGVTLGVEVKGYDRPLQFHEGFFNIEA